MNTEENENTEENTKITRTKIPHATIIKTFQDAIQYKLTDTIKLNIYIENLQIFLANFEDNKLEYFDLIRRLKDSYKDLIESINTERTRLRRLTYAELISQEQIMAIIDEQKKLDKTEDDYKFNYASISRIIKDLYMKAPNGTVTNIIHPLESPDNCSDSPFSGLGCSISGGKSRKSRKSRKSKKSKKSRARRRK